VWWAKMTKRAVSLRQRGFLASVTIGLLIATTDKPWLVSDSIEFARCQHQLHYRHHQSALQRPLSVHSSSSDRPTAGWVTVTHYHLFVHGFKPSVRFGWHVTCRRLPVTRLRSIDIMNVNYYIHDVYAPLSQQHT